MGSVGDGEKGNIKSSQSLGQFARFYISRGRVSDRGDIILQLGVGVGNGIGEVDRFILFSEVILELKLASFSVESIPTYSFSTNYIVAIFLVPFIVDENIGFHALGIEILFLAEIADIELNLSQLLLIVNFEVEPGSMSPGVCITPQEEIVLLLLYPDCHVEISSLKSRVEVDLVSVRVRDNALAILANSLDGFLDDVQGGVVPRAVSPIVVVLLVDLDRVGVAGSEVDNSEAVVGGDVGGECVEVGVVIGEGEGAGGQFRLPAHCDVGLQGVVLCVEDVPGLVLEVVSHLDWWLIGGLGLVEVDISPAVVLIMLFHSK